MFLLYNLDIISPLVVLVYFFLKRPKAEGAFLWFILFVSALFFSSFTGMLLIEIPKLYGYKRGLNNLFVYHIGCIAFVFTLCKFFSITLISRTSKIIDTLFIVFFSILSIYNFIYQTRTFTIYGLTSIWVSIKCLSYYAYKFNNPAVEDILKSRTFWIISGLFLYFTVTFFIFISYDFFTIGILKGELSPIVARSWLLQNVILALSCGFYLKAITCKQ